MYICEIWSWPSLALSSRNICPGNICCAGFMHHSEVQCLCVYFSITQVAELRIWCDERTYEKNGKDHISLNGVLIFVWMTFTSTWCSNFSLKIGQTVWMYGFYLLQLPVLYSIISHIFKKKLKNIFNGWQLAKMKRVFLTCPCHKIYRDEAVGLKSCKNTWKITIFVKMWNLGQYRENLIFCL